jgi:predicted nucleic acid-binding protein
MSCSIGSSTGGSSFPRASWSAFGVVVAGVLVDTSAWVLALHRRDPAAKRRLKDVVAAGAAATCPMVMLELLAGRSKGDEPAAMRRRLSVLVWLGCTDEVWERAYRLTSEARSRGHTLPGADALIAAHALVADATLLHADSDFVRVAAW